ncbi:hypothetical protein [Armatimonas rosea]|uniref:Uncharacterized protein n=1 Tax=Armatimonas rosea TaxID=685828 RepID=A0A7W9SSM8_ARMRO|nr:hypothetical protein [Armatimonas rosea]MBB6052115.1 hypothetical protein [Armatimonas rosea]
MPTDKSIKASKLQAPVLNTQETQSAFFGGLGFAFKLGAPVLLFAILGRLAVEKTLRKIGK